ncbi:MAG: iron-containing redox enzyme family protein [Thaumarchaeota archaeon]|nr:iron-containing redox enzyme family protein [Nitrososphaerota archaeon]
MSLLIKIDAEIEKQSLLKHPFYRMWSDGKLTQENLAGYSMEYFQLVKVVPRLVSNVASFASPSQVGQVKENVDEELTHIEPWIKFAGSLGVTKSTLEKYSGAQATLESVRALDRLTTTSFEEGVAAMYAYEKQLPEISRSKIDGLRRFYGKQGGDATKYFELHEEADVRHAAVWRAFIAQSARSEDSIMRAVAGSLKAQNDLLDSVMANHC